jgi:hypothetical protein
MKIVSIILIVLGLISVVAISAPAIGLIAYLSIIGIPIAMIFWAAPAMFLILAGSTVAYQILQMTFTKLNRVSRALLAASITLVCLAAPPYFLNGNLFAEANKLTLNDLNKIEQPLSAHTIAAWISPHFNRGTIRCDGFCMHSLLTGTAKTFIALEDFSLESTPDLMIEYPAFWIEKRQSCPSPKFEGGRHQLKLSNSRSSNRKSVNPVELMKVGIAKGSCLIEGRRKLSQADLILWQHQIRSAPRLARRGLMSNPIKADRITALQINKESKNYKAIYRKTQVQYWSLFPILLPAPQHGYQFQIDFGWWRDRNTINIQNRFYSAPDWPNFLTEKLGLELELGAAETTHNEVRASIARFLASKDAVPENDWIAIAHYYDSAIFHSPKGLNALDAENAVKMLLDQRFPVPPRLYKVSKSLDKTASLARQRQALGGMLSRLYDIANSKQKPDRKARIALSRLGSGVKQMPDEAFDGFEHFFTEIALSKPVKIHAYKAISRLSVYGARTVPTFLELMNDGMAGGDVFFRNNEYQHPYLAGIVGLCLLGEKASASIPTLRQWLRDDRIPFHSSYGDLAVTTLARIGFDTEELRQAYSIGRSENNQGLFDHVIKRAQSGARECSF